MSGGTDCVGIGVIDGSGVWVGIVGSAESDGGIGAAVVSGDDAGIFAGVGVGVGDAVASG